MSLGDDILILLPDSALELPEASAKPDAFETPRGPRPDLLLPSPPGINIIEPTPNINFADNDGFVPEAISAEEDPVLRPSFSESSRSPTTESRKSFSELSVASETTRAIERRRSSLSTTMEFRSRRRSSSNNSLPAVISRISRMDEYKLLETLKLGGGATAQVIPAVFKPTNTPCAVKMLFKEGYNARFVDVGGQWKDEIRFLKMIDKHPNVVTVLDAWEDPSYYCTVMDLARGGDVQGVVEKEGPLPEAKAAILMAVLINVLDYIHQVGILHRDVRPPNILFLNKERDPSTSIVIDFGLAIKLPPNGKPVTERNIGAPFYTAPEISDINSPGYGPAADMYSAGCVAYFLLTGRRPPGENSPVYGTLSAEAIDFVEGLRNKDQFARLNARQALDHPWIRRHVDAETLDYLRGVNEEVLAGKTIGPRTATFIKPPEEGKKEGKTGFKAKVKAFFSKVFRRKNGQ